MNLNAACVRKHIIKLHLKRKCFLFQAVLARKWSKLVLVFVSTLVHVVVKRSQHFRTGAHGICRFPRLRFCYALPGTHPVLSDKHGNSSPAISTKLPDKTVFFPPPTFLNNLHLIPVLSYFRTRRLLAVVCEVISECLPTCVCVCV